MGTGFGNRFAFTDPNCDTMSDETQPPPEDENPHPKSDKAMVQLAWIGLLDELTVHVPDILKAINARLEKHDAPIAKWSIVAVVGLITCIVGCTACLVSIGKLDGQAFTFVMGTLIGVLIIIARGLFGGSE